MSIFDEVVDRTGIYSYKWDIKDGELPMWVADMDFKAPKEVIKALHDRTDKATFGYNIIPDSWYEAYISWWQRRHNYKINKDNMMFSTGVVPSISSIVRRLTHAGENVIIQTPVYNIFFNSILNNGRKVLESPLIYSNGKYEIDFIDLEAKMSHPQTTLMILCNPHNPVGYIWKKEELIKIASLAKKYNVKVISDEIHCDITKNNISYTPFLSVSDDAKDVGIMLIAPTKAFSLAGLQTSAIVVENTEIKNQVYRGINNDEIAEPNSFAIDAAITCFNECEYWINELNLYIDSNKEIATKYINDNIKDLFVVEQNATYLMWVDISKITDDSQKLCDFIRSQTGLFITEGIEYGQSGKSFVRINVACPKSVLYDGLSRLEKGIKKYKEIK